MPSAGESSASYRWILTCVPESHDMCGFLDVFERMTQNTDLCISCAGCCAVHQSLAESLHPVYCLLAVTTGGIRTVGVFLTAPSGAGPVDSPAICSTAFPLYTNQCLSMSLPKF